jgi:hypothetical protein
MKNLKLWKYSGILLILTGILHTIVAIIIGIQVGVYEDIVKDGLINAISTGGLGRELALWFLVCGIFIIFFGQILHYYIKREQKPAPLFLGYNLLILSILGGLMEPVSGFWIFVPQALIIIFANRKRV